MQHYKALKEATYGSRIVKAGDIVAADDSATLDPDIWQAVPATHAQGSDFINEQHNAMPMGMNTDPRLLSDYSKLEQENAKLRGDCAKLAELNEQHTEIVQQMHGLNILSTEQKNQIDHLHGQLASQTQLLADKETEFATCMQELQAENASLKKQLADVKKK